MFKKHFNESYLRFPNNFYSLNITNEATDWCERSEKANIFNNHIVHREGNKSSDSGSTEESVSKRTTGPKADVNAKRGLQSQKAS